MVVLIASNEGENFGRKMMLRAHRAGGMGFEMARLPQHVSLKQTFSIPSLERVEKFFDEFVKKIKPIKIEFEQIDIFPNNSLGGIPSGVMSLRVIETPELKNTQLFLFDELNKEFGPCPAEHDDDYIFQYCFLFFSSYFVCLLYLLLYFQDICQCALSTFLLSVIQT